MSRLHLMKTGKITAPTPTGVESNRKGERKTKIRAKTARALGFNYTPTAGWRTRSQIRSTKMVKAGSIKGMKKQAKETVKGDAKPL
jgi:hypothetical protein